MTDQEINERIAEFCGWRYHESTSESGDVDFWAHPTQPTTWSVRDLPQYVTDLNAIHEAEKTLRREGEDGQGYSGSREWFQASLSLLCDEPIHATALERAKAFLETIYYLEN
jgi:hypothetical protein